MAKYDSDVLEARAILQNTVDKGVSKANASVMKMLLLGFLGGAFISLGYLAYIRVVGAMPLEWAGLANLLGAAVFPIGLICILLGGAELVTGNMMVLPVAWLAQRISVVAWMRNWCWVGGANLLGALCVAWFFGHYLGLTEGVFLAKTIAIAQAKVAADAGKAIVSGIGCNWLVCMSVWLCYASKSMVGKFLGIWFPIMIFVLIGFQHVVANMFVIPAAIWGGAEISWGSFLHNVFWVFWGNALGGAVLVGMIYFYAYRD